MIVAPMVALPMMALPAQATTANDDVVISEVYVKGDTKDGKYYDFVELYNPTNKKISLTNYSVEYFSSKGKGTGAVKLLGDIAPKGHFLILGNGKNPNQKLQQDAKGKLNMAVASGSVKLTKNGTTEVDLFGWGAPSLFEKAALDKKTNAATSYQRTNPDKDTNDNSVDFTVAEATPTFTGGDAKSADNPVPPVDNPAQPGGDSGERTTPAPEAPADPAPAGQKLAIADIQGTGSESPHKGKEVTTTGVVTAVYKYGFYGFYMQTPGDDKTPDASDGIFVYSPKENSVKFADIAVGKQVEVTGTVDEYYGLTQIKHKSLTVLPDAPEKVKPVVLNKIPDGDEAREKLEGMLVKVTGKYTVSSNYNTSRHGTLDLAPGESPFRNPSDVTADKAQWPMIKEKNERERIALDDGSSVDYTKKDKKAWKHYDSPVPYLDVNNPLRVGTVVTLPQEMILDYRSNQTNKGTYEKRWSLQPTKPLSDKKDLANKEWTNWVQFTSTRQDAPQFTEGNLSITSFNVLNYFTTLGEEFKCKGYSSYDGIQLTSNNTCNARGAASQKAFEMQQSKIVKAINALDSSIVGLEEIENSVKFGKDRDTALNALVAALNKDAGSEKWVAVKSPAADKLPALDKQDFIRLAFIYQKDKVKTVGESEVLIDGKQWAYARQPLAQKFVALENGKESGKPFVIVVNHLKSKGSDKDPSHPDDGFQGNNNHLRVLQVTEMAQWVAKKFADEPVFILGDLNSYTFEDPLMTLEKEFGYTSIAQKTGVKNHSYQYGGLVGSLDHALGNPAAMAMVKAADVWNVNAMEPLAFEYSRYNYNINYKNLFDAASPFRSSDHDPIKVAIETREKKAEEPKAVSPEATAVMPHADDPAACKVKPFVTVTPVDGVTYSITVDGKEIQPRDTDANTFEYDYGKTVVVTAKLADGYTLAEGAQTTWTWTAPSLEELKCVIPQTELTPAITKPAETKNTGTAAQDSQKKTEPTQQVTGLAKTGASVLGITGVALLLIVGGTVLTRRRQK